MTSAAGVMKDKCIDAARVLWLFSSHRLPAVYSQTEHQGSVWTRLEVGK